MVIEKETTPGQTHHRRPTRPTLYPSDTSPFGNRRKTPVDSGDGESSSADVSPG